MDDVQVRFWNVAKCKIKTFLSSAFIRHSVVIGFLIVFYKSIDMLRLLKVFRVQKKENRHEGHTDFLKNTYSKYVFFKYS